MNQYELYHEGVKRRSGRYPWGSGSRPYQSMEKSKRKSVISSIKEKKEKRIEEERKQKLLEEAEEKKRKAEDKERVLREGSALEVMEYFGDITNQELRDAVNRINLERSLKDIGVKEKKETLNAIDSVMQDLKMITGWGKIATEAYNTIADFYNSTESGKKDPLSKIGGSGKK